METKLTISAPCRFSAEKNIFFRKFYIYFSFYAREKNFKYSSFFSQLIQLFHRTMKKKIENTVKYELFLSKPLTLTLFRWRL